MTQESLEKTDIGSVIFQSQICCNQGKGLPLHLNRGRGQSADKGVISPKNVTTQAPV